MSKQDGHRKGRLKVLIYVPIKLNVPPLNDERKVYSQAHGSPVLEALSFKSLGWISTATFAEFTQFWENQKFRSSRNF